MKADKMVQEVGSESRAKPDRRAELAGYLARQPQSRRTFDKAMKVLEVAGLILIAGYLAWAIYVSIDWTEPGRIAAVWFGLPICVTGLMIVIGLHGAGLRAFFPVYVAGSSLPFSTGSQAVWMGLGFALLAAVAGAFWGAFAWVAWTEDLTLLDPLLRAAGVVIGAGIIVAVASDLYKRLVRSR